MFHCPLSVVHSCQWTVSVAWPTGRVAGHWKPVWHWESSWGFSSVLGSHSSLPTWLRSVEAWDSHTHVWSVKMVIKKILAWGEKDKLLKSALCAFTCSECYFSNMNVFLSLLLCAQLSSLIYLSALEILSSFICVVDRKTVWNKCKRKKERERNTWIPIYFCIGQLWRHSLAKLSNEEIDWHFSFVRMTHFEIPENNIPEYDL